jgi:hypothetical protein
MHAADSWRARLSIEEQAAWYNPGSKRGARHRELVLLAEYLRSIARLEHRPWVAASRLRDVAALAAAMSSRALRRRAARLPLAALEASSRTTLPARLWLLARRVHEAGLGGTSGAIRDVRALPDERVLASILGPRLARRDPRAHALAARWLREPEGVQQRAAAIALGSGDAPEPRGRLLSIAPGGASMGTDGS